MRAMANVWIIYKRELSAYFGTPIAYVFLAIFVFLSGIFAFYVGNFFEREQADLQAFFQFHPWLYLFLIPALSMRLWAEERRAGTIELLFTLPGHHDRGRAREVSRGVEVHRDRTVAHVPVLDHRQLPRRPRQRGHPRGLSRQPAHGRGVPRHRLVHLGPDPQPVIAFVVSGVVCLGFVLSGFPLVLDFVGAVAPPIVVDTVRFLQLPHPFPCDQARGVLDAGDVIYFVSLIVFWLFVNAVVIEWRKAG